MMTKALLKPQPKPSTWVLVFLYRVVSLIFFGSAVLAVWLLYLNLYGRVGVKFEGSSAWALFAGACVLYFTMIYSFWFLLRNSMTGRVFDLNNVQALRRIAFCLLFLELWNHMISQIITITPNGFEGPSSITFGGQYSLDNLLLTEFTAALVFFALAEIFRQGYLIRQEELRLREEQDLTV